MTKKLTEFRFPKLTTKFISPSFDDLDELTFDLALAVIKSGKKYNRLVVLAKGGWTMARNFCDYLNMHIASSIQLISYDGMKKLGEPIIAQSLGEGANIQGESVLVFDDVNDTGDTLEVAVDYLKKLGAREVDCATLFFKPHSKFKSTYFSYSTPDWIVFPHEKREFITQISKQCLEKGVTKEEVERKLLQLGLPRRQVAYFLKEA